MACRTVGAAHRHVSPRRRPRFSAHAEKSSTPHAMACAPLDADDAKGMAREHPEIGPSHEGRAAS